MSWVACATGSSAASQLDLKLQLMAEKHRLKLEMMGYVPPVYFQHCHYCTKAPDEGQKEARCTSCGAPLKQKGPVDHSTNLNRPSSLWDTVKGHIPKPTNDSMYTNPFSSSESAGTSSYYEAQKRKREAEEEQAKKRRKDEEEETQRRNSYGPSSNVGYNVAMGDITGSGIPGGYDMDITTPL